MSMSSSERITEAELARSRKARAIAKNWLEAETTRLELAGLDPALGEGTPGAQMRPSKYGKLSPLDRVREARVSGLEIREFEKGLGEGSSSSSQPSVDPREILDRKAKVAATLALQYPPEKVKPYLEAIEPFLNTTLASDPWAQRYLMEKFTQGQSPTKDSILEAIRLGAEMRGAQPNQQLDVGQLMKGMSEMFRAGIEVSKSNGNTSPSDTLNSILPLVEKMTEGQRLVFESQMNTLREELKSRDPAEFVDTMKRYADLFGWTRQPESEQVQLHRLNALSDERKMAFELEKERWTKEWDSKMEDRRAKNTSEMIKGVMGTATRVLESPVLKELGKSVGAKIPGAGIVRTLNDAKQSAAKEQLENPLSGERVFDCPKCRQRTHFTPRDLISIQTTQNGRWVCPSCSEPYVLQNSDSDKKDEGGTSVA